MALVVKKEEELDCHSRHDSLKVESNDSKDAKPPLAIIAREPMKAEDIKPDVKLTRIRYFMDAVVITTRPQYVATEGPRQVKGARSSKRAAVKKESVSNSSRRNTVKVDEESGWVAPAQDDVKRSNRSGSRSSPTSVNLGTRTMTKKEEVVARQAPIRLESPESTIPQLIIHPSTQVAEKEGKMTKWKNPKMKVKKESAALTKDTIISRISAAGISFELFPVNCPDRDVMVSREFMSRTFGGSSQKTFPRIGKKKFAEHGLDDYMYLPTDYQPIAPEVPGAPGLWLDIGGEVSEWQGGVMRVFTRITTGPALWLYQGNMRSKCPSRSPRKNGKGKRFQFAKHGQKN